MALKKSYLLLYNLLSLLAWTYLTARVILTIAAGAAPSPLLADITALQTAAGLEVAHAALGLVRSSPGTTALQVGGRNLVRDSPPTSISSFWFGRRHAVFRGAEMASRNPLNYTTTMTVTNPKCLGHMDRHASVPGPRVRRSLGPPRLRRLSVGLGSL